MIESSNPEINVQELMAKVRREAHLRQQQPQRQRTANGQASSPPPPSAVTLPPLVEPPIIPPFQSSGPLDPKKERIDQILKRAREMTEVARGIPKLFRGLFRSQGGFNRAMLETVGSLAKTNAQLNKRVQELTAAAQHQNHWLQVLVDHRRADLAWMQAAAPVIASFAQWHEKAAQASAVVENLTSELSELRSEVSELGPAVSELRSHVAELRPEVSELRLLAVRAESMITAAQPLLQTHTEQLRDVRADAARFTDELRDFRADAARSAEHLRNLQKQADVAGEHLRNLQRTADELLAIRDQHERAAEHLRNLQIQVDRQTEQLQGVRQQLERDAEHLRNLQAQADRSSEHLRHLQDDSERATDQLKEFERIKVTTARVDAEISHLADFRRTLSRLEERQANDSVYLKGQLSQHAISLQQWLSVPKAKKEATDVTTATAPAPAPDGAFDVFYLSFENRFRGERSEIKERVRFYLPFLKKAKAGTAARPILDVGCGRGEWLELLEENGLRASGVDLNSAMIAQCQERKFDVTQADAIEHLRSIRANTLGCVSGFHIIEHLPFEVLLELFAQTRRVLKPGGLAIFESPNCKNLMVGACYFNVDPTHRNPVFPETAEFMMETQGFANVQLEYLSPARRPFTGGDPDAEMLNDLLFGPQDFAVIGRKPAGR